MCVGMCMCVCVLWCECQMTLKFYKISCFIIYVYLTMLQENHYKIEREPPFPRSLESSFTDFNASGLGHESKSKSVVQSPLSFNLITIVIRDYEDYGKLLPVWVHRFCHLLSSKLILDRFP